MNSQEEWSEYQGYWWLPEFPDRTVAGTLTGIKTGNLELSLLGQFEERNLALGVKSVTYPTILGIVSKKLISLSNCHIIGSEWSSTGLQTEKLSVNIAFIGDHIHHTEDAKFNKIILKFDHFDEWLCIPFIRTEDIRDDSGSLLGYDFSYRIPNSIKVDLEEFNICIDYCAEAKETFLGMIHSRNIELRQFGLISLSNDNKMSLDEWNHKFINPWQDFLTLATGEPSRLQSLQILEDGNKIDVLFRKNRNESPKEIRDWDMLFTLRDIYHDFGNFIKSWLSVSEKFDSVCNLFFSTKYTSSLYLENQFLPIAQSIESYHRRSDKFNYKKEFTLKERMQDIFDFVGEVVNPLVEDKNEFIKTVVSTRNHNIHFNNKPEDPIFHGRDLFWAARILGYMLQACLLREIGFSDEETGSLFRRNQEYSFAEGYIRDHYFKKDKQVNVNHTPEDESDPLVGMFSLSPTASISTEPFSAEELLTLEGKL
jgi:hypothetical protein